MRLTKKSRDRAAEAAKIVAFIEELRTRVALDKSIKVGSAKWQETVETCAAKRAELVKLGVKRKLWSGS